MTTIVEVFPKPSPAITASLKLLLAKRCVTACLTFFCGQISTTTGPGFEPLVHGLESWQLSLLQSFLGMLSALSTSCEGPAWSKINDKNACMHRAGAVSATDNLT